MWNFINSLPGILLPAAMFYFFFWRPARRVRSAKSWRETPCVILSSAVKEDETDSGLYTILMSYRYEVDGYTYTSSRYSFSSLITAGRRGKLRVTRRLAPGTSATCWVNPDDPHDAVIHRGFTWDMIFSAILALVFLAVFLFVFGHGGFAPEHTR